MSNVTSISSLYLQILSCHFCAVVIFLVGGWITDTRELRTPSHTKAPFVLMVLSTWQRKILTK